MASFASVGRDISHAHAEAHAELPAHEAMHDFAPITKDLYAYIRSAPLQNFPEQIAELTKRWNSWCNNDGFEGLLGKEVFDQIRIRASRLLEDRTRLYAPKSGGSDEYKLDYEPFSKFETVIEVQFKDWKFWEKEQDGMTPCSLEEKHHILQLISAYAICDMIRFHDFEPLVAYFENAKDLISDGGSTAADIGFHEVRSYIALALSALDETVRTNTNMSRDSELGPMLDSEVRKYLLRNITQLDTACAKLS